MGDKRGLLIFGSSHVGKSRLASRLGAALGWQVLSTDQMGRHPGRPWLNSKPEVEEYFSKLSDHTIYWLFMAHHQNMWPLIKAQLDKLLQSDTPFVLEGAALRPEYLQELDLVHFEIVGLWAEKPVLKARMYDLSGYFEQDDAHRIVFDRFIQRSLRDNDALRTEAEARGMRVEDVTAPDRLSSLEKELLGAVSN